MSKILVMFLVVFLIGMGVILSSFSSLVNWVFMELTTFFFIPMMLKAELSYSSVNIVWKYFVVQGVGSFLFFISVCSGLDFFPSSVQTFILLLSMVVKLGIYPFSGWVFHVVENMNWLSFLIFSTVMKIVPLVILTKSVGKSQVDLMVCFLVILSSSSVLWLMLGTNSARIMLGVSSMINLNWMLLACLYDEFLMLVFSGVYIFVMTVISFFLSVSESLNVSMVSKSVMKEKFLFVGSIIFMMGFPPLGFFFVKVEMFANMAVMSPVVGVMVVVSSSVSSFLYLKLLVPSILEETKIWFSERFSRVSLMMLVFTWVFMLMSWIIL